MSIGIPLKGARFRERGIRRHVTSIACFWMVHQRTQNRFVHASIYSPSAPLTQRLIHGALVSDIRP